MIKRLPDYPWMPARYSAAGDLFTVAPDLIVIHSGSIGRGVAEYLARCPDGRRVSAHVCWSTEHNGYVQQVEMDRQAWHAGGSRYQGRGGVNTRSFGIELPGPAAAKVRSDHEQGQTRILVARLVEEFPSLRYVTRHSDIDPRKRDPGPGFLWSWLDGIGLETL